MALGVDASTMSSSPSAEQQMESELNEFTERRFSAQETDFRIREMQIGKQSFSNVLAQGIKNRSATGNRTTSTISFALRWPHTVIIDCDASECPYKYQDVLSELSKYGFKDHIKNIGNMGSNAAFLVGFDGEDVVNRLLQLPDLKIKGKKAICTKMTKRPTVIRLKWTPTEVPDSVIKNYFNRFGHVQTVERQYCLEPNFRNIELMERKIIITLNDDVTLSDIPDFLHIGNHRVAVSVLGRPPLCLKCFQRGHIRMFCTMEKDSLDSSSVSTRQNNNELNTEQRMSQQVPAASFQTPRTARPETEEIMSEDRDMDLDKISNQNKNEEGISDSENVLNTQSVVDPELGYTAWADYVTMNQKTTIAEEAQNAVSLISGAGGAKAKRFPLGRKHDISKAKKVPRIGTTDKKKRSEKKGGRKWGKYKNISSSQELGESESELEDADALPLEWNIQTRSSMVHEYSVNSGAAVETSNRYQSPSEGEKR